MTIQQATELGAATRRVFIERCAAILAQHLSIGEDEILGHTRMARAVRARQLLVYHCSTLGWTTTETGQAIGRDHSTMTGAIQKMRSLVPYDAELRNLLALLPTFGGRDDRPTQPTLSLELLIEARRQRADAIDSAAQALQEAIDESRQAQTIADAALASLQAIRRRVDAGMANLTRLLEAGAVPV